MCRLGLLSVVAAVLFASTAVGQELHTPFCLHGCPLGASPSNDIIVRSIYVISVNETTKFADWAAYRVDKTTIGPTADRVWRVDPFLAADETLEPPDYDGANAALRVDRGHQVPLASFTSTPEWEATNYLSNITPQKSALNQGPWEALESAERTLARRADVVAVYVMTGPVFQRDMPALPKADEPHRVPSAYWKIVAVQRGSGLRLAGFYMDQETPRNARYCDQTRSVEEIEKISGLKFFPAVANAQRQAVIGKAAPLKADLGC